MLADRLRRSFRGGCFYGLPNVRPRPALERLGLRQFFDSIAGLQLDLIDLGLDDT